jgi:hypothetical protein
MAVVMRSIGASVATTELEDDELGASELDIAEEIDELDEILELDETFELDELDELDELELGAIDDELDE